jgi:hypothetical protein
MPIILAALLQNGLSLMGNAFLAKGKDWVEEKTGVSLDAPPSEESLLKLKQFELENETELQKLQLEDNKLDLEMRKMAFADTDSARRREVDIATSGHAPLINKVITPLLACLIVVGGGWMIWAGNSEVRALSQGAVMLVLGYYFGTSVGSREKQITIDKLSGGKP